MFNKTRITKAYILLRCKKLISSVTALGMLATGIIGFHTFLQSDVVKADMKINDSRPSAKWEKVGHAYNNYVALKGDVTEYAAQGGDVGIKPNDDGTLTVTLTYNRQGIRSDSNTTYFPTRNPWYSFALSKGYGIVGDRTYELVNQSKVILKE